MDCQEKTREKELMIIFWSSVPAVCSKTLNLYSMCCFLGFSLAHFFDWTWMYLIVLECDAPLFFSALVFLWSICLIVTFSFSSSQLLLKLSVNVYFLNSLQVQWWVSEEAQNQNALAEILLSRSWVNPPWSSASSCLCLASGCPPLPALARVVPSQWWCTARRRRHHFADALGPLDFSIRLRILSSKLPSSFALPLQCLVSD